MWGLNSGEVLRIVAPRDKQAIEFTFNLAQTVCHEEERVTVFSSARREDVERWRKNGLPQKVTVYPENASNDIEFILGHMKYAHPKLVFLEGLVPPEEDLARLKDRARREQAALILVTTTSAEVMVQKGLQTQKG